MLIGAAETRCLHCGEPPQDRSLHPDRVDRHHLRKGLRGNIVKRLILRDGDICRYCRIPLITPPNGVSPRNQGRTVDHIVPLGAGGNKKDMDNVVLCCATCNGIKGDGTLAAFLASREFEGRLLWSRRQRGLTPNGQGYWHLGIRTERDDDGWSSLYCPHCDWSWDDGRDAARIRCVHYFKENR